MNFSLMIMLSYKIQIYHGLYHIISHFSNFQSCLKSFSIYDQKMKYLRELQELIKLSISVNLGFCLSFKSQIILYGKMIHELILRKSVKNNTGVRELINYETEVQDHCRKIIKYLISFHML